MNPVAANKEKKKVHDGRISQLLLIKVLTHYFCLHTTAALVVLEIASWYHPTIFSWFSAQLSAQLPLVANGW